MTRAERAAEAAELKAMGLNGIQIAERMGIARSYAYSLLNDPTGSIDSERKEKYAGECIDCGARTDGTRSGAVNPVKRCASCQAEHEKRVDVRRENAARARTKAPRWSREAMVDVLARALAATGGPTISAQKYDLWRRTMAVGETPSVPWIIEYFDGWVNAIRAAGGTPTSNRGVRRGSGKITEQTCMDAIAVVWLQVGRAPTYTEFETLARGVSGPTARNKLGPWMDALDLVAESFPLLASLPDREAVAA